MRRTVPGMWGKELKYSTGLQGRWTERDVAKKGRSGRGWKEYGRWWRWW